MTGIFRLGLDDRPIPSHREPLMTRPCGPGQIRHPLSTSTEKWYPSVITAIQVYHSSAVCDKDGVASRRTGCASAAASARYYVLKSLASRARSGRLDARVRPPSATRFAVANSTPYFWLSLLAAPIARYASYPRSSSC